MIRPLGSKHISLSSCTVLGNLMLQKTDFKTCSHLSYVFNLAHLQYWGDWSLSIILSYYTYSKTAAGNYFCYLWICRSFVWQSIKWNESIFISGFREEKVRKKSTCTEMICQLIRVKGWDYVHVYPFYRGMGKIMYMLHMIKRYNKNLLTSIVEAVLKC